MLMCAPDTVGAANCPLHDRRQSRGNFHPLPRFVEELREDLASRVFLGFRQIQRKISLAPAEDDLGFNPTATSTSFGHPVFCNKEVICIPQSEHIDADKRRRDHNRVTAVCRNAIDWLEP